MTKISALTLALAGALVLSGCGGGNDNNRITRGDRNAFMEACAANTNTGDDICACVADLAQEELSPHAFHLVLAGIQGNDERAEELRRDLTIEEATEAGAFMFTSFAQCAQAGNGASGTSRK